ncbi:MAG: hypothetical protein VYE29_02835 [Pseudomonadota bacterium]|nr:hypothetical protein [Pseudomonadota bacterium]
MIPLSLLILSWQSHQTLKATLESYRRNGLLDITDDKLIYFQQISKKDIKIAEQYGLQYYGSGKNIGIGAAYRFLAERARHPYILYLQNDFQLIQDVKNDPSELTDGIQLLSQHEIDVVLYRSRSRPGEPNWATDNVRGNEERWQSHLFNSLYWMEKPEQAYPDKILRNASKPNFLQTTARHMNYTDNPALYRRDWLLETLGDYFTANDPHDITWPERVIQPWWEMQDFRIAQAEGLFEHIRLDRGGWQRRLIMWPVPLLKATGLYDRVRTMPLVQSLKAKL